MFLSGVLLPIFFGLSILVDGPVPLLIPLTIFLTGLSLMLYSRIFAEETPSAGRQQVRPARLGTMYGGTALPPAAKPGLSSMGGEQVRTAELAQPPSVTEHTTKLLDHE